MYKKHEKQIHFTGKVALTSINPGRRAFFFCEIITYVSSKEKPALFDSPKITHIVQLYYKLT